ncbi:hypothetical protein ACFFWC_04515 [Plantactinospora siamensis]|uniref:Uncharacterized protein n=1 Tax=Plantactinospora siamensis TaxID=555372 RepID=A0ABV6NT36_9ACTN
MSEPSNPAAPAPGVRSSSVTISTYLLYAVAALQVISAIVALSVLGKINSVYKELYAGTSAEGAESFATVGAIVGVVVSLLLAVAYVVLGMFNNRGKNASRIVTWVLAGIGVCCTGGGLAGRGLTGSMGGNGGNADVPSATEVQNRLNDVLPSWYGPVAAILSVLAVLALLAVIILLALPASNAFFRKPQPGFEPPTPGAAYPYPQTPGYPSAPGESQTPGYPPSSGQPGQWQPGQGQAGEGTPPPPAEGPGGYGAEGQGPGTHGPGSFGPGSHGDRPEDEAGPPAR